jgi:hypothetical protein
MLGVRLGVVGILAREDVKITSNSQQTPHHNTSLTATNITLNTTQNTKIKGANLQATNQLNLNTNVGILAREDVKILTVYVDLSVICVGCVICIGLEV